MDDQTTQLLAIVATVAAVSVGYSRAFGSYQSQIVEWWIAAFAVRGRYKGLVNLAVGVVLAGCFAALAAWQIGDWSILAVGLLAGVLASVEAAKVHDTATATAETEKPKRVIVDPQAMRR